MEPNTLAESRASKTTNAQFKLMLDFMKKNGDLSTKTSGPLVVKVKARHKWTELIDTLNAVGPEKSLKQWFKVWADWKSKVKSKIRLHNSNLRYAGLKPLDKALGQFMDLKIAGVNAVWADWKSKVKSKIRLHNSNLRYAGLKPLDKALGQFMDLKIAGVNADRDYKEPAQPVGDRRFRLKIHGFPQKPRTRVLEELRQKNRRKSSNLAAKHRVIAQIEKMKLAIDKKIDVRKRRKHDLKKKQVTTQEDIERVIEKRIDLEEKLLDIQEEYLNYRQNTLQALNELFEISNQSINKLRN